MTLVVSDFVSRVYQEGVRLGFAREGVAAYMVRRGSNYPCPVCDDVCAVIHPISEHALRSPEVRMLRRTIDRRRTVTGNQEYIKIGNEATSKIATIVHQKR